MHAVLLAAGNASRFGSSKQVARLEGVSLVRRAARAALELELPLLVVTGAYEAEVRAELADLACTFVHNAQWERGMGSSIGCAFRALLARTPSPSPSPDAALLCLADQPRVGSRELRRLSDAHACAPSRIVIADHGAVRGPPGMFPHEVFAELAALEGPRGAKGVLERHAGLVDAVPMPEAAIDIDTQQDLELEKWRARKDSNLRPPSS